VPGRGRFRPFQYMPLLPNAPGPTRTEHRVSSDLWRRARTSRIRGHQSPRLVANCVSHRICSAQGAQESDGHRLAPLQLEGARTSTGSSVYAVVRSAIPFSGDTPPGRYARVGGNTVGPKASDANDARALRVTLEQPVALGY